MLRPLPLFSNHFHIRRISCINLFSQVSIKHFTAVSIGHKSQLETSEKYRERIKQTNVHPILLDEHKMVVSSDKLSTRRLFSNLLDLSYQKERNHHKHNWSVKPMGINETIFQISEDQYKEHLVSATSHQVSRLFGIISKIESKFLRTYYIQQIIEKSDSIVFEDFTPIFWRDTN